MPDADWKAVADQLYGNMPHPKAPDLKVRDFPVAVQLATATKFGGYAEPHEASMFWKEFLALGMQPGEYLDTLDRIAPLSFRFQGKPPTMQEIKMLSQAPPDAAHKYYASLPDADYPDLMNGQMVKALAMADPYSQRHLQRPALKVDAQFFHHAQMNHQAIDQHYQFLAQDKAAKEGGEPAATGQEQAQPQEEKPRQTSQS